MDQRPDSLIGDAKGSLRLSLRAKREALPASDRAAFSRRITEMLLALPEYRQAETVLAYMSMGAEFDTDTFARRVRADGKALVLPRVNRAERRLDLYLVEDLENQLAPGVWDIREPSPMRCELVSPETIDFALVPGLGFDARGGRLGYGGGFYDRLLVALPAATPRVAAAFSAQVIESVPMGARDQYVDLIVTENGPVRAQR